PGLRREGLYTSVYVFVERLGYSLGPILLGFILKAGGLNINLDPADQPASAATAILFCMVAIPAIAQVCMVLFVWFYRLPEIIKGISKI
ncbi:MAG: MFS transporter, partial [Gammaproteobacteria bacterium]|nr:MFS transporter [Gammaproteobacteria bacterium]